MKYMGSKRAMLENGLGHLLRDETKSCRRFVDLFTGSGAVASFVAQRCELPVIAFDIQSFCVSLASAVVTRTRPINVDRVWAAWLDRAKNQLTRRRLFKRADSDLPSFGGFTKSFVTRVRNESAKCEKCLFITRAYGGHYFSQSQALWIDALRLAIPSNPDERNVALAALIAAASQCAAAPGHTAQPFQPTAGAKPFLFDSWNRSITERTRRQLKLFGRQFARVRGRARIADADCAWRRLSDGDLAFVDPPYSGVHYSRFYHVLETISRGECGPVSGVGRYPPKGERPQSNFSLRSEARYAISRLLRGIAQRGAVAIVTFPDKKCSNGISSYFLMQIAAESFSRTESRIIRGRFSTLGGDGEHRDARQISNELILILRP